MATVVRSSIGDAAERASRTLLETFLQKQQLDMQRQRLGMEEERLGMAKQGQALGTLLNLAPFVREGTSVADNAFLHDLIREGLPGRDPLDASEGGIGSLVFNKETLAGKMDEILRDELGAMEGRDPEFFASLMERGMIGKFTGEARSQEELAFGDERTRLMSSALDNLTRSPARLERTLQALGPTVMGLEQPTHVRLPDGRSVEYDTQGGASLSVDLFKFFNPQMREGGESEAEVLKDMARNLQQQVEKLDSKIILGPLAARQIVSAINAADPGAALEAIYQEGDANIKTAIEVFVGAARVGENSVWSLIREHPQGQAAEFFGQMAERVEEWKGFDPKERQRLLGSMTEMAKEMGVPMLELKPGGLFRKTRLSFEAPTPPSSPGSIPFDDLRRMAQETIDAGEMTIEQIREIHGDQLADSIIELGGADPELPEVAAPPPPKTSIEEVTPEAMEAIVLGEGIPSNIKLISEMVIRNQAKPEILLRNINTMLKKEAEDRERLERLMSLIDIATPEMMKQIQELQLKLTELDGLKQALGGFDG